MGGQDALERRTGPATVAIVGLGVRGLCTLERLISHAAAAPELELLVHLVDARPAQPPQYDVDQPDYLLLNHASAGVSMFPAAGSVVHVPPMTGPDLFDWAHERGLRVADDGFTVGSAGRPVTPEDNLPRRVFGEYLRWFYQHLRDHTPANLRLVDQLSDAVDLKQDDDRSIISLANGEQVEADYVFVTVGQRPQQPHDAEDGSSERFVSTPYPLPQQLSAVSATDTVAIAGLGLTAADAIFALTVGRGGWFDQSVTPERYVASGLEPRIVLYSRSGRPYRARATPSSCVSYEPVVFTRAAIDRLRDRTALLDFDQDVLPLLLLELRVAYRRATILQGEGAAAAEAFLRDARADGLSGLDLPDDAEFDAAAAYHGTVCPDDPAARADGEAYQRSVESFLAADIAEAADGFTASPFKAATETAREVRDIIRYAVEFGGLTDESLDRFFSYHVEAINRLVIGPEKARAADLLTLLRSGVVSMALGPAPEVSWEPERGTWKLASTTLATPRTVHADWLYRGFTDRLRSVQDDPTIVGALARRGIFRLFRPDSSVVRSADVDRNGHPIGDDGTATRRIWLFGLLCEGATFYNGYLTSPDGFNRAQFDADRAVDELLADAGREQQLASATNGGARR